MNQVEQIKNKFNVDLPYRSDDEMYQTLEQNGVPSLAKLLKLIKP